MHLSNTRQLARSVRDDWRRFGPRAPLPLPGRTHLPLRHCRTPHHQISQATSNAATPVPRPPARWRVRAASLLLLPVLLLAVIRCLTILAKGVADSSLICISWFGDAFDPIGVDVDVSAGTDPGSSSEAGSGEVSEAADLSSDGLQQAMGTAAAVAAASSDPAVHDLYGQLLTWHAASVVTGALRAAVLAAWPFLEQMVFWRITITQHHAGIALYCLMALLPALLLPLRTTYLPALLPRWQLPWRRRRGEQGTGVQARPDAVLLHQSGEGAGEVQEAPLGVSMVSSSSSSGGGGNSVSPPLAGAVLNGAEGQVEGAHSGRSRGVLAAGVVAGAGTRGGAAGAPTSEAAALGRQPAGPHTAHGPVELQAGGWPKEQQQQRQQSSAREEAARAVCSTSTSASGHGSLHVGGHAHRNSNGSCAGHHGHNEHASTGSTGVAQHHPLTLGHDPLHGDRVVDGGGGRRREPPEGPDSDAAPNGNICSKCAAIHSGGGGGGGTGATGPTPTAAAASAAAAPGPSGPHAQGQGQETPLVNPPSQGQGQESPLAGLGQEPFLVVQGQETPLVGVLRAATLLGGCVAAVLDPAVWLAAKKVRLLPFADFLLAATTAAAAAVYFALAWRHGTDSSLPTTATTATATTAAGAAATTTTATSITTAAVNPFAEEAIESTLRPAKALALASLVLCVLARCAEGGLLFGEQVAAVALLVGGCGPCRFRDARMVYWHLAGVALSFVHTGAVGIAFTRLMMK